MDAFAWRLTLAATALMALVIGSRSAFGLFVGPLNGATGIGLAGISLAAAIGQLGMGLAQPLVGRLAERHGAARLIATGAWALAAATAALVCVDDRLELTLALLAGALASTAVGSNALLVGELGRRLPAAQRGLAVGLVGAGGSAGQLLLSPTTQALIEHRGWVVAMLATAALYLLALPLSRAFRSGAAGTPAAGRQPVGTALRRAEFWRIAGAFGICGFHIGFLGMHMPGVIERCGLAPGLAGVWLGVLGAANIAGSVAIGFALRRWPARGLLAALYASRAAAIVLLLCLPLSTAAMLGFALLMGLTYMAVLPPTSQWLAQRFGVQRLGTLFGVVMLVHQVGSFGGVWLGGWIAERSGGDTLLWRIDIALALLAVLLVLPRPGSVRRASPPAWRPA